MSDDQRRADAALEEARYVAEREASRPQPRVARCRSCKADVYWAVTGTGAAMPVNVEPHPDGNLSLRWNGVRVLAVYVDGNFPGPRRMSHFATCSFASTHRRRR